MDIDKATNEVLKKINQECKIDRITREVMTVLNDLVCNDEKWITIKPHGEDSEDYRRLKLEDGETPKQAIDRVYKKQTDKKELSEKTDTNKKELTERVRSLTKERDEKRAIFKKLDKQLTKIKNEYNKVFRNQFTWANDNNKTSTQEEIDIAHEKYENKLAERNNAVREVNKLLKDVEEAKLNALFEIQKGIDIEKSLKNYNTDDVVKKIEQVNKEFDYDKLIADLDVASKKLNDKKDEWAKYVNDAKTIQEQNERLTKYEEWYGNNELGKEHSKLIDKLNNFKTEQRKAISKALQISNGGKFELMTSKGGVLTKKVEETNNLLNGIINKDYIPDFRPVASGFNGNRAYASGNTIQLNSLDSVYTSIHECMHWLEGVNPEILANSKAFLKYRTKNDEEKTLRQLTDNKNYKWNERAKADKFFSPYCGKEYMVATEIMSMGVQQLFEHPETFYKEDREYFNFVIGNLRGEL